MEDKTAVIKQPKLRWSIHYRPWQGYIAWTLWSLFVYWCYTIDLIPINQFVVLTVATFLAITMYHITTKFSPCVWWFNERDL